MQQLNQAIPKSIVDQILRGVGHLDNKKNAKNPNLTMKHIWTRFDVAKQHLVWKIKMNEWDEMILENEKQFNLRGHNFLLLAWSSEDTQNKVEQKISK